MTTGHRVHSIVFGDVHRAKLRPWNALAALGLDIIGKIVNRTNLLDALKPEIVFFHYLFDKKARNHHNINDDAYAWELAVRSVSRSSTRLGRRPTS